MIKSYLSAMRLDRWPRSTAIVVGSAALVFIQWGRIPLIPVELLWRLLAAFLLTWGISTANYIINEIVDAPYDAHHPTKRFRPLLQGKIKTGPFILIGIVLIAGCLTAGALLFSRPFFFSLLSLLAAGFIYNIPPVRTKDIPFLDSLSESANNPIRFLIGWFAFTSSDLSPPLSLLICWWAFGNFLLVGKRLSEFRFLKDKAGDYRTSLKKYSRKSLVFGMTLSSAVFFTAYIIFILHFNLILFFGLIPFILVFFVLVFRKTLKEKEVMEEPERLLKHPPFAAFCFLLLTLFILAGILSL